MFPKGVYQETSGPTITDPYNAGCAERIDKPTHAEKSDFSRRAFFDPASPGIFPMQIYIFLLSALCGFLAV